MIYGSKCLLVGDLVQTVTQADEDNSIPTDDANRAIIGNVAMYVAQVVPPGGQNWN